MVAQDPPPTAEEAEPEKELDTLTLVRWCIAALTSNAWQRLGLIPSPATQKVERNIDDARLAIDAATALADRVKPHLTEAERRELENLLNDLRLNFLQQKARP
jgi:hypothetical protein